eukprot:sb/3461000/
MNSQEPTDTSKQPIRTHYLGHMTGYQPIRDQYFLIRSIPVYHTYTHSSDIIDLYFNYIEQKRDRYFYYREQKRDCYIDEGERAGSWENPTEFYQTLISRQGHDTLIYWTHCNRDNHIGVPRQLGAILTPIPKQTTHPRDSKANNPLIVAMVTQTQALVGGSMAGFIVDVTLFPIDTIKTRMQSKEGLRALGMKDLHKLRGVGTMRNIAPQHEALVDYFHRAMVTRRFPPFSEWMRTQSRMRRSADNTEVNELTIKYEEKQINPAVKGIFMIVPCGPWASPGTRSSSSTPNFKAYDFDHFKSLKQAEMWRPRKSAPSTPEEPIPAAAGATSQSPTNSSSSLDASKTIYTDNKQIYGEGVKYSDIAAKAASSEKYQPPHKRTMVTQTQALVGGSMAGFIVDVTLFPIDTIKTRMQSKEGLRALGMKDLHKLRGVGTMRNIAPQHEALVDYFHREWMRTQSRMRRSADNTEVNELTIKYEEKQINPAVKAPNFKAYDFDHFKSLKQAEMWRPRKSAPSTPEEPIPAAAAGATPQSPTNSSSSLDASKTIYTDNKQIYGEGVKYSDIAAKAASSEKYQPPHKRSKCSDSIALTKSLPQLAMMLCRRLASRLTSSSLVRHGSRVYPELQRGDYSRIEDSDMEMFQKIVGPNAAKTEDLEHYNTDWLHTVSGFTELVLCPGSVEEVSAVLRHCNERKLAVIPQGGNTGLVGGSNPVFDEIVLSMERMSGITNLEPESGVVECQAGVVLQILTIDLSSLLHTLPKQPEPQPILRQRVNSTLLVLVLGVKPRHGLTTLQRRLEDIGCGDGGDEKEMIGFSSSVMSLDNTGYDLKQLFIGSEGTLGVITDVSLLLPQAPTSVNVAMFGCKSFEDVVQTYRLSRQSMGEIVSACEFMDRTCMKAVNENLSLSSPFPDEHPFYFIVETSGSNQEHDMEKLEGYVARVFEEGVADDGVLATSKDQAGRLMALRENIAPALKQLGYNYKYDVSLPIKQMYSLVEKKKVLALFFFNISFYFNENYQAPHPKNFPLKYKNLQQPLISHPTTTTLIMMKLAIFIGVLATCALSASVVDYKKRADNLELEKRGNSSECFVCPSYREYYSDPPCYPYSWFCDGYKDCPSGIDEAEGLCGEFVRDLDEIMEDIAENAVTILAKIGRQLVTDDYDFLEDVYEETRNAAEKINDVGEKTVGEENCISVGYGHLGDNNLHLNLVTPTYSTQVKEVLCEQEGCHVGSYGHISDGDLHLNPISPQFSKTVLGLIEPFIYEEVAKLRGSISAEHGLGLKKANYLKYSKDSGVIDMMRVIKGLPRRAKSIVRFEYTVGPRLTGMLGGSLSSRFPTSGEIYPPGKLGCPPPGISGSEIYPILFPDWMITSQ